MRTEPPPIVRAIAAGLGYGSKPASLPSGFPFNIKLVAPDMGFRTFRPGRNPKEHTTP